MTAAAASVTELNRLVGALRETTRDIVATEQSHEQVLDTLSASLPEGALHQMMGGGS